MNAVGHRLPVLRLIYAIQGRDWPINMQSRRRGRVRSPAHLFTLSVWCGIFVTCVDTQPGTSRICWVVADRGGLGGATIFRTSYRKTRRGKLSIVAISTAF